MKERSKELLRTDWPALHVAGEFRNNPLGHHSPGLDAVLSVLRSGPVAGKFCLICVTPHRAWAIGRLSGIRGVAPVVADNRLFHSIEHAEWEVFRLRWAATWGPLPNEDAP